MLDLGHQELKNISTCGSLTKDVGKFFFFFTNRIPAQWDPRISDLTWEPKLFTRPEDYKMLTNVPQRNRFWRPLTWQSHSLRQLELSADCQALKTAWQAQSFKGFQIEVIPKRHVLHIVEIITECQTPKTAWQVHCLKGLVKIMAEFQDLKTTWQKNSLHALVELEAKRQALKTHWPSHSFQPLNDIFTFKCQALKTRGQAHFVQPSNGNQSKMPISAPSGKLTCLNVWMTSQWKVNSCRSSGNALSSKYKYAIPESSCQALKSSWQVQFLKGFVWEVTKSEAHLASSLLPVSGWTWSQTSSSEWRPLGKLTPFSLWLNLEPKVKLWRPLGKVTPSKLWLKSSPNFKLWRLLGKRTPSMLLLNLEPNDKILQVHAFQGVVEIDAKRQTLKTAWQAHCV